MSDTIIVKRTGQAPLRVRGEVIAENESSMNNASPDFDSTGRKRHVQVIKTATGKYVVAVHHTTIWQGEHDTDEAAVLPSLKECVEYLRDRVPAWMLEELIRSLGEEAVAEEVE